MTETNELLSFISDINELKDYAKNINTPVESTFIECLNILHNPHTEHLDYDLVLFKINSVIDYLYDGIYTGHWSNVSDKIRQNYAIASFIKVYVMILKNKSSSVENIRDALRVIDLGLLLGAKLNKNKKLLLKTASYLTQKINSLSAPVEYPEEDKKRKRNCFEYQKCSKIIETLSCPSIEKFNNDYFIPQVPVKLINCMTHWPAMSKWSDVNYLLSVAGERTVPIELGSQYTDSNWGQKLMTLRKFIENYFLKKYEETGYLAQYNLFDQVSELRNDIHIPEYCCLSKNYEDDTGEEVAINAWFGPENTVSPLHSDIKDNILAQVFGTKHLVLFPPSDIDYLYPHEEKMLNFTSRVNPLKPDLEAYPEFKKATMYECYLEEGDMLFIPSKWWHHVTALEKSFSVNFWWS